MIQQSKMYFWQINSSFWARWMSYGARVRLLYVNKEPWVQGITKYSISHWSCMLQNPCILFQPSWNTSASVSNCPFIFLLYPHHAVVNCPETQKHKCLHVLRVEWLGVPMLFYESFFKFWKYRPPLAAWQHHQVVTGSRSLSLKLN